MKYCYLFLLFVITACSSGAEENRQNTQNETLETVSDINKPITEVEIGERNTDIPDPDSLIVPSFAIHFEFSEGVQKLLDSGAERLMISIILSGQPIDRTKLKGKDYYSDEDEIVYLKDLEMVYKQSANQTLTIENLKINKEALNTLEDPNYNVGISFYSSRTSSDNNVFYTEALLEKMNMIKAKTHTVKVRIL